jgi:acetyl esterase/lipase
MMLTLRITAVLGLSLACAVSLRAQTTPQASTFTVTLDAPVHGKVTVTPALPADGKVAAGTVLTITATPDAGYAIDSTYFTQAGRFGQMPHENPTSEFKVTIDQNKHVGASFIEEAVVKDLVVTNNVEYAKPGVKPLKYDVFAPKGARNLPIIVIIHGGGWNANDEDVMRGLARELTKGGKFVAVSMDYRWAEKADGDATNNTMADLIDDCYGGILHIMEHAAQYGGDATRIGVTGDSAGGHLSAAVSVMTNMIGSRGFGKTPGVFEYMPSYLPKGMTVEQARDQLSKAIKAAAPSYGVFSAANLNHYSTDPAADQTWKEAIAPLSHIPQASDRAVPTFLTRGTRDQLIQDAWVKEYTDALVKAGQRVEYVQVGGASHAFFDWKPDARTKATFAQYGVYYAARMQAFFASVMY